jgi:hypothetical protein
LPHWFYKHDAPPELQLSAEGHGGWREAKSTSSFASDA